MNGNECFILESTVTKYSASQTTSSRVHDVIIMPWGFLHFFQSAEFQYQYEIGELYLQVNGTYCRYEDQVVVHVDQLEWEFATGKQRNSPL